MSKKRKLVDYEEWVTLNGDKQNIRIHTYDETAPVLLFIHGGPGVCDRHWVLHYQGSLAEKYTMVLWDQRGSGKSYRRSLKKQELHREMYVEDARALVEYLCEKFGKEKIVVLGHSWGTIIGTPLVAQYPEHIAAYVGQGQFIEGHENELISFNFVLEEARKAGDTKTVEALEGHEPVGGVYENHDAMLAERDGLSRYGGADWKHRDGLFKSLLIPAIKWDGYHIWEIPGYAQGALYLTDVLWPEVVAENFFEKYQKLEVPVLMTTGRHDYNTPFELARKWFEQLEAPVKEWRWFEESAHSPIKEEPEKWNKAVSDFLENLDLD